MAASWWRMEDTLSSRRKESIIYRSMTSHRRMLGNTPYRQRMTLARSAVQPTYRWKVRMGPYKEKVSAADKKDTCCNYASFVFLFYTCFLNWWKSNDSKGLILCKLRTIFCWVKNNFFRLTTFFRIFFNAEIHLSNLVFVVNQSTDGVLNPLFRFSVLFTCYFSLILIFRLY